MFFETTIQIRVEDFKKGQQWYETLFEREPDFIAHEGFIEWEIISGCWLQVAEGTPAIGSGPIRFGVTDIEETRNRLLKDLKIDPFEVHTRDGVPVKWGTFQDPWGNLVGVYEYLDKDAESERLKTILRNE
ncbi:VOC family protein [Ureibacillus sp. MALMAid1270]|uniref:VOC family protein n=1 Tax=Ureibacillus sp. MALMAid1270 TaxID=3411629 RepID=UPI003BA512CE